MTAAAEHKDINLLLSANSPCHWRGVAECLKHLYECNLKRLLETWRGWYNSRHAAVDGAN